MENEQVKRQGRKIKGKREEIVELHPTKPDITELKKVEESHS